MAIFQVQEENQQKVLVPLTDTTPVDEVVAGNVQSVTSNAVAVAISFSETEHQVGYWIDGSPLYERTVQVNVPRNGNYIISIPGTHKVKDWRGNFFQGSIDNPSFVMHIPYTYVEGSPVSSWIMLYSYASSEGRLYLNCLTGGQYSSNYFNGVGVITYRYTKTS